MKTVVPSKPAEKEKILEWFHTGCGSPIEERNDTKVESFRCSNKKCWSGYGVLIMPQAIFKGIVDCREV